MCEIQGYELFDEHRKNLTRGGVAVYVNKNLQYIDRKDLNVFEEGKFESCFVEITCKSKNTVIGEIYRIPGTNENDFIKTYEGIVKKIKKEKKNIIIGTDQNLDYLKVHQHANTAKFLDCNLSNDLLPTISKPTRITHTTCTLIDNIYINVESARNIKSMILSTHLSDHLPCLTILGNADKLNNSPTVIKYRKLNEPKIRKIRDALQMVDWHGINELDANSGYNFIVGKVQLVLDSIAPEKILKIDPSKLAKEPWITKGIMNSSKICDKKFKSSCGLAPDHPKMVQYKLYRNLFNSTKRKAKREYYIAKIEQFRTDAKKMWKILKEITGKNNDKSSCSNSFTINGSSVSDSNIIRNEFSKYYSTMGKNLVERIGPSLKHFSEFMPPQADSSLYLYPTSQLEIVNIVKKMKNKNSSGHDGISNFLLKSIIHHLKYALNIVFNNSIQEGVYPDQMKLAEVVPIYKSKRRDLVENYRPVSLLHVISKVLERIIYKRLFSFLCKKALLYDSQYGFRNKRSTIDAVTELSGKILHGLERKEYTLGVYLDLSRAFDTVPHDTLLSKLNHYGIRGNAHKWFTSYLHDRKMYVQLNGKSNVQNLEYGVPHGSVLGPLLFIILTNDINNALTVSKCVLFADDTTVYVSNKNLRFITENLRHDLASLSDWFRANKLTLHLGKTNFILFKPKNFKDVNVQLSVNNISITRVKSTKFLGLIIDEHLTWESHGINVANRVSKNLYMLRSVRNLVPSKSLRNLYFSYIHSIINYGLGLWGPMISVNTFNRSKVLQKKAVRVISKACYNANTAPSFRKLQILRIGDMIDLEVAKLSFRFVKNELPTPIRGLFTPNAFNHNYNTRARNEPRIARHRTSVFHKSFLTRSQTVWSALDASIKHTLKFHSFRNIFVKQNISTY